jgi:cytoskeletal protein CcmA (bactofilin family)
VQAAEVIIGAQGKVTGLVAGQQVTVSGKVSGAICAKTVTLQSTSEVEGDIHHMAFAIEQGAVCFPLREGPALPVARRPKRVDPAGDGGVPFAKLLLDAFGRHRSVTSKAVFSGYPVRCAIRLTYVSGDCFAAQPIANVLT